MYELLLFLDLSTTRITSYDFQCADVQGVKISDHTRFDTALIACLNAPNGGQVKGGTYRINRDIPPVTPPTGSAVLTWTGPTLNTNGTPIETLVRYELQYSLDPGNFVQAVNIASGNAYTVPGLTPGTWYFRMRVVTVGGTSGWTNLASKVIA